MNVADYINSGILETYVLGLASGEDVATINILVKTHPEVLEEIERIEETLMAIAKEGVSTTQLDASKKVILQKIDQSSYGENNADQKKPEVKVITPLFSQNKYRVMAIAASILLVVSLGINFYLFSNLNQAKTQLAALESEKSILAQNVEFQKTSLQKSENTVANLLSSAMHPVFMKGVASSPTSKATVYWNSSTHETFVTSINLPEPPADKQYQLWALVDGKPVDAGVFDISKDSLLQKVKNIDVAQAFAVTLENKGGSDAPTLTAMYVVGNL